MCYVKINVINVRFVWHLISFDYRKIVDLICDLAGVLTCDILNRIRLTGTTSFFGKFFNALC